MRHRLTLAAAVAAAALAASVPSVHSAFSTSTRSGQSAFDAAAAFAPRNLTPPAISGTAREGETLTTTTGTWARGTDTLHTEWFRCAEDETCRSVATGTRHVLTAGDVGHRMQVRVTATNAGGSASATSARTAVVAAAPPVNTAPPTISGTVAVDEFLTADPGTWTRAKGEPSYRWLRCTTTCTPVPNDTGQHILMTGDHADATMRVEVTYGGVTATSAPTTRVERLNYTHVLCTDPETGNGVAGDGVLPDGWSHTSTIGAFTNPAASTRCAGGAGIPVSTGGTFTTSVGDDRTSLQYRAGAHTRFDGATLYRHGTMSGRWAWAFQTTDATGIYSPRVELCTWGDGCTSRGSATPRFGDQNRVTIPGTWVNGFNVTVACDIPGGWSCSADGSQVVRLFGGVARLRDEVTPNLDAPVTGTLRSADPLPETATLDLAAQDAGSGLYRVRVRVNGMEQVARRLNDNGGRCADARPGVGNAYEFAHRQPCALSFTGGLAFDTTAWPRGRHRLRVLLEDAGRNTTTIVDRVVTLP